MLIVKVLQRGEPRRHAGGGHPGRQLLGHAMPRGPSLNAWRACPRGCTSLNTHERCRLLLLGIHRAARRHRAKWIYDRHDAFRYAVKSPLGARDKVVVVAFSFERQGILFVAAAGLVLPTPILIHPGNLPSPQIHKKQRRISSLFLLLDPNLIKPPVFSPHGSHHTAPFLLVQAR